MRYEIRNVGAFIEVKTYGEAELQVFKDFIRAVFAHEQWQPEGALLIDHSELDAAPLTTDDIQAMIAYGKRFQQQSQNAKIAIIVDRDLAFGMGRMWQALALEGSRSSHEVFRSRDEAIAWLKAE